MLSVLSRLFSNPSYSDFPHSDRIQKKKTCGRVHDLLTVEVRTPCGSHCICSCPDRYGEVREWMRVAVNQGKFGASERKKSHAIHEFPTSLSFRLAEIASAPLAFPGSLVARSQGPQCGRSVSTGWTNGSREKLNQKQNKTKQHKKTGPRSTQLC